MPTLLTNTSIIWSQKADRLLLPIEHLAVMGVPTLLDNRAHHMMYGVEKLARQGDIDSKQQRFLAGNGMHMIAIGSVLTYTLSVAAKVVSYPPSIVQEPVGDSGKEDDEEDNDDYNVLAEAALESFAEQPAWQKRARTG